MNYKELIMQVDALTAGVPYLVANLANVSAVIWQEMERINWAGFYLLKGDTLYLGPFQGKTACVMIPVGRGVCGTAAATRQLQLVPDIEQFPGHIACDSASRSEIVIPLLRNGKLLGVMDIDAPIPARFDELDAQGLTAVAAALTTIVDWSSGLL